ncbi:transposase, partial [Treponema endosymbiont of Eucomonympha sp.]|uniref:transposase n=1 Tax=Treponema endosymbiont of Eucomonympha sp. TaxID=1580831 RepID=UPI000AAABAE6
KPCGGWNTKMHALTAGDATLMKLSLSAGSASGAKEGRRRLKSVGKREGALLLMDRAYEDSKTRAFAEKRGFNPVAPPKRNRKEPRDCDLELYRQRNGVERSFRRVCTRYDKLDVMFSAFIYLASISIVLRHVPLQTDSCQSNRRPPAVRPRLFY